MKSGKQRRAELDTKRKAKRAELLAERAEARRVARERELAREVRVNREALAPHGSYSEPEFVSQGYYSDQPFDCIGCGKSEIWTATQQKWWYEVAKGYVFATARRCRACRRRERERKAEERRIHLEGLARKKRPSS